MMREFDRRAILGTGGAAMLLALPGCESLPGFSLTEAIRRLLTISSQNALTALVQENGFFASDVARLQVPDYLGGSTTSLLASLMLRSRPVQDRLLRQINRAAEKGAELAAPLVAETVRNMSISDAASIVRGGPTAATDLLRGNLGATLANRMLPGIGEGLRLFDNEVINLAIRELSGVDFARIRGDVTAKAADAIYTAIGAEEARIRRDPQSTGDPLLIGVFGLSN